MTNAITRKIEISVIMLMNLLLKLNVKNCCGRLM